MKPSSLIAVALALASPLTAQNEAPPDSTATESKRSHRVTVGLVLGATGGALVGLHFQCGRDWVASPHVPLDEQDPCPDGGITVGEATLIGAALGAFVGFAVDVEATGRAELRVGPDRMRARRVAVGIQIPIR